MHLINCHGIFIFVKFLTILHPCGILPLIALDICNAGSSSRTQLRFICIRIGLINMLSVHSHNKKFIKLSNLCFRDKCLKYTDRACLCHRISLLIPIIKLANYRNSLCIRRPHSKINAFFFPILQRMSAKLSVHIIMGTLAKKILVKLCKL